MLYIYKEQFLYLDYHRQPNFCILRLYKLADNTYICVATENNGRIYGDYACKGAGITNAAEYLLTEVERQYEIKVSRVFLHYPPRWERNSRTGEFSGEEEFCEVSWGSSRRHPFYPELIIPDGSTAKFSHLKKYELEEILGETFAG
jgi:hypothetical protein